jgi:hypothetical protein
MLPYEILLDYARRDVDGRIRCEGNLVWPWNVLPEKVVRLRTFHLDAKKNRCAAFFALPYDKIKVKTYPTDRALTGDHKTNREKRWETHPQSVQFGQRRDCLEVEYTLINQLCHFAGFPKNQYLFGLEESQTAWFTVCRWPGRWLRAGRQAAGTGRRN